MIFEKSRDLQEEWRRPVAERPTARAAALVLVCKGRIEDIICDDDTMMIINDEYVKD